jgi:transcriptional regulator with XRE-family HTH domain
MHSLRVVLLGEFEMGYYDEFARQRIEVLRRLHSELGAIDFKDDAEFQRIFREAQALLEMSDQEIADALSVSRPSVNRWTNGRNLPYPAMRKHILGWIAGQLDAKIKRAEAAVRQTAASLRSASSSFSESRAVPLAARSR